MQHDFVGVCRVVSNVALAPVIGNCVGEDGTVPIESGGRNGSSDAGVSLETVLCVLIPIKQLDMGH